MDGGYSLLKLFYELVDFKGEEAAAGGAKVHSRVASTVWAWPP